MEMQDVDYEVVFAPGKDEADPLDFPSRHPLPETGHDKNEKIMRWDVNAEHTEVVIRIRPETQKDEVMQRLAKRIVKGDWEKHKSDKDLGPLGHLGKAKTKQMLREKCCFPQMNSMIGTAIEKCYEYQVATKIKETEKNQ